MLLAIDVGNTNIVFAVFSGDDLEGKWRLSTDTSRTSDEYAVVFRDLLQLNGINFSDIKNIIISSVVPQHTFEIKNFCNDYFSCKPMVIGEKGVKVGMDIDVDRASEVGADRLVNAVSAYKTYKKAAIIIDFGTATTFDVINKKGAYIGGLIAPGINLSLDALHAAAAKLPEIAIKKPSKVIGKSTVSAMQSGIYFGYKGLIEGIIANIRSEIEEEMITIATGGLAPLFAESTDSIEHLEPNLTINGLNEIYKINI